MHEKAEESEILSNPEGSALSAVNRRLGGSVLYLALVIGIGCMRWNCVGAVARMIVRVRPSCLVPPTVFELTLPQVST